jgi:alkylated DNA nucleotide flippase Atl1
LKGGLNPRLVGRILSRNTSLNEIPCFRVVCSNGFIGGYVNGMKEKKRRLEKESVRIKNFKIVQFKEKLFDF